MTHLIDRLNPQEIFIAYDHIEGMLEKTPLVHYKTIYRDGLEMELLAKMDTLNPGGSFKDRGGEYFIYKNLELRKLHYGGTVVTASAGNHGKGVAAAVKARNRNMHLKLFMSKDTPETKIQGARDLGADIILEGENYGEAAEQAEEFARIKGFVYVPAFKHEDIILGQSTIATEIRMQNFWKTQPDFYIVPFGGGGLANGIGFAADSFDKESRSKTWVFGVQAENFNTAYLSFKSGSIIPYTKKGNTIADGIRVLHASQEMLDLTKKFVDDMFDVTEAEIESAIREVYTSELIRRYQQYSTQELMANHGFTENHTNGVNKMNIVEGAAAAAFACAEKDSFPYQDIAKKVYPRKKLTGVIVASGNNIDNEKLQAILAGKNSLKKQ